MEAYLTGLTVLDAEITAQIPPQARARAGAVVGRMLQAGYTAKQANLAISALYVSRNQRALVKLWGMLDRERWGAISTALFDKTMLLFSEVLEEDQLPELRAQLGFVNPAEITLREFEAALRLLVPTDGSPADLRKIDSNVSVVDLLGGAADVERMQSFQQQRVARLAQRMHNFGYDSAALQLVCRTLFLTRLHNKDLWQLWRFFSKGQTEVPLTLGQTRHLLSLLSEGEGPEKLDDLVRRVDADGSGSVEFDEFAVLLRAINPQAIRPTEVEAVAFESHPLVQQVQALQSSRRIQLMYADPEQVERQAARSALLTAALKRVEQGATDAKDNPPRWKRTLALLREVSAQQHAQSAVATRGGALHEYCADGYADGLCKQSQASAPAITVCMAHAHARRMHGVYTWHMDGTCTARARHTHITRIAPPQALASAAELLENHPFDSYEAHVALRTVRAVDLLTLT